MLCLLDAFDNVLIQPLEKPDRFWVTDITYIKTQKGFAYLAIVRSLFASRYRLVTAEPPDNRTRSASLASCCMA